MRLLAALVLTLAAASSASAQCELDRREPLSVTPSAGAGGVTVDAFIRVEYTACYFETTGDDPNDLISLTLGGAPVRGLVQRFEDTVFFVPEAPLRPDARYEGTALGITRDLEFSFLTGAQSDLAAPSLGELETVTTTRLEDGSFRVDVAFAPATDDGPLGSIEYLLYLSRAEGLEAPELRATARSFVTELVTMAFVLEADEAVGPVCVVVHAVDGVGRIDSDGAPYCFEPEMGSFFEGCSVAGSRVGTRSSNTGGLWWFGLGLCALLLRSRRRARV